MSPKTIFVTVPTDATNRAKGVVRAAPAPNLHGELTGEGLVARFSPVKGVTPARILKSPIWLPAVLNTVTLTEGALHNEYDTLSAGQFSQPAMAGPDVVTQLRDIPLDTLVIDYEAPWLVVSGQDPCALRLRLVAILRSRMPVHLMLTFNPSRAAAPELDMNVTLRQGTREIRAGEHDTRYMSLQVKEWRDPRVGVHSSRPAAGNSGRKRGVKLPATHKLKATDTLASLSREYYGAYSHWREIRTANGIPTRWGQDTPLVKLGGHFKVGAKVRIPKADGPAPVRLGPQMVTLPGR